MRIRWRRGRDSNPPLPMGELPPECCMTWIGETKSGAGHLDKTFSGYLCLHRTSDLRVSIAALAKAVASEPPSKIRPTRSGESQARWIRLLT
jgi:hypothetical protein